MKEPEFGSSLLTEADVLFGKVFIANESERGEFKSLLKGYRSKLKHIGRELKEFWDFLEKIPIDVVVFSWLEKNLTGSYDRAVLPRRLAVIKELGLCRTDRTAVWFARYGHQSNLEYIRRVKSWTIFEKEEMVRHYLEFSQHLMQETVGLIRTGFDPDRHRVARKAIKYESFIDFVQQLSSERDCLIAKLLYFGAPSLNEVLSLKVPAIDFSSFAIRFEKAVIAFPCHVIDDLKAHIHKHANAAQLVFANPKGAEVERAHLNQSFARACENMEVPVKITPASLLKSEGETENFSDMEN